MIPTLFKLGPLPVHAFGLMLVLAFLASWRSIERSLKFHGEDTAIAENIVFWAALGGVIGARIWFLLSFPKELLRAPLEAIFSSGGFIFYGGFLGGTLAVIIFLKLRGKPVLAYADYLSPAIAIGYAVGRIGCQLSGDGDYGSISNLPWAMSYASGVIPTPEGVLVHPSPVYETTVALLIAAILVFAQERRVFKVPGQIFGLYLALTALERFAVEFLRIEPIIAFGLTQAQLFAIGLVLLGIFFIAKGSRSFLKRGSTRI